MIIGDEHGELLAKHDRERKASRNRLLAAAAGAGVLSYLFSSIYLHAPWDLALAYAIGTVVVAVVLGLIIAFFTEKRLYSFIGAWVLLTILQALFPSYFEPWDRLTDMPSGARTAVEEKLKGQYKEYKPISFKAYLYPSSKYIVFAEYYYEYNSERNYGASRIEPHIAFEKSGKWETLEATIENQKLHNINIGNTPFCADRKDNQYKQKFCLEK